MLLCVVTLLIAGGIIVFVLFRGGKGTGIRTPAQLAEEAKREAQATDYSTSEAPPIAQFMASYKQGDDLFDDSFSIDSPSGEFLGECGVGISETIGVGDPKKVTAFEVWLFDKNDIQTVTKVLMSAHAFSDDAVKQRLAAKGEPVEARTGEKVVLETQTLQAGSPGGGYDLRRRCSASGKLLRPGHPGACHLAEVSQIFRSIKKAAARSAPQLFL